MNNRFFMFDLIKREIRQNFCNRKLWFSAELKEIGKHNDKVSCRVSYRKKSFLTRAVGWAAVDKGDLTHFVSLVIVSSLENLSYTHWTLCNSTNYCL